MRVLKILSRAYVCDLSRALPFYEGLLGQKAGLRFSMPGAGLELAQVRELLLIAGTEEALRPFRDTAATLLVDDLEAFRSKLLAEGATVLRGPQDVPTGRNMTVRHADGSSFEYVEHRRETAGAQ
jgi:predicted enzyme related to lactoylglutathione lyase